MSSNTGKRIIVTGCAGGLGTALCKRLLSEGNFVDGIDNLSTGQQKNVDYLKNKFGEAFSFTGTSVEDVMGLHYYECDEIYHAASPASPPKYNALPFETISVNTIATEKLLDHAKEEKAKFLFFSTSEVYGDPTVSPQPETYTGHINNTGPRSIYDNSKRMGETITAEHHRRFGTDTKIVRIFNTASPYMDPDDGRVITNFVKQALLGQPYSVYGDGHQTRSICYVDDLLDGIIALMASDYHEPVNLGNDKELSVLDIAKIVHETISPNGVMVVDFESLPKDDPKQRRPDLTLAKSLLNYNPKVSIEETIKLMAIAIKKDLTGI